MGAVPPMRVISPPFGDIYHYVANWSADGASPAEGHLCYLPGQMVIPHGPDRDLSIAQALAPRKQA